MFSVLILSVGESIRRRKEKYKQGSIARRKRMFVWIDR